MTTIPVPSGRKVDGSWLIYGDLFETDYTTVIHPIGMTITVRIQLFGVGPNLTFNVDDFLTPTEMTFQGSGTFKGIQRNRAVINTTDAPVKCHVLVCRPSRRASCQRSRKSQCKPFTR
jgi:hypothetical protein